MQHSENVAALADRELERYGVLDRKPGRDLQALADVRSWYGWRIGQALSEIRPMGAHEMAIA